MFYSIKVSFKKSLISFHQFYQFYQYLERLEEVVVILIDDKEITQNRFFYLELI